MISGLAPKISGQKTEQKHGFLQFSQKTDYGLFLLMELAKNQVQKNQLSKVTGAEPLSLRNFAEKNGMSFFFMQKVAFELRKAGLVTADRGKNGGYVLAKSADEITLKEIIEVLEGPVSVMHCLGSETLMTCSRQPTCQMRHGLGTVNKAIVNIFTQTTLSHLFQ